MKKIFFSVAILVIAVLSMTSCSNKERCWAGEVQIKVKYEGEKDDDDYEFYTWGTEDEVNVALNSYKKAYEKYFKAVGAKATVSYTVEKYKATKMECEDASDYEDLEDWIEEAEELEESAEEIEDDYDEDYY